MDIAIAFDLTIVGPSETLTALPQAVEVITELQAAGHNFILITTRTGENLTDAETFCDDNSITPDAVNIGIGQVVEPTEDPENPGEYFNTPYKVDADIFIDVKSLGCPLTIDQSLSSGNNVFSEPRADWTKIREYLVFKGVLTAA